MGHSLPSRPVPVPTDVRFAAKATELLRRAAKCREGPTGYITHHSITLLESMPDGTSMSSF